MERNGNSERRSPEEGLDNRAGPVVAVNANDQWRGRLRAPRRQNRQLPQENNVSITEEASQHSSPSQNVVQPIVAPIREETVRRRKWTHEMNCQVMRSYLRVTLMETRKTLYRKRMFEDFIRFFPDMNITEQRLADQRRVIISNKLLPDTLIQQIRQDIARELAPADVEMNTREETVHPNPESDRDQNQEINGQQGDELTTAEEAINHHLPQNEGQEQADEIQHPPVRNTQGNFSKEEEWLDKYYKYLTEFEGMNPNCRPKIPKVIFNHETSDLIRIANNSLKSSTNNTMDIETIHLHVYCVTISVIELNGQRLKKMINGKTKKQNTPAWDRRLANKIEKLRIDIGRTHAYIKTKCCKLYSKLPTDLKIKLNDPQNLSSQQILTDHLDTLKQRLSAITKRLRRYRLSYLRKQHNFLFQKSQKDFYRNLDKREIKNNGQPSKENIEEFWRNIWTVEGHYKQDALWIQEETERNQEHQMTDTQVTREDLQYALKNLANWKAPGRDGVQNFWYKNFTNIHIYLAHIINELIQGHITIPNFLTEGLTYLIPKSSNTKDPSQYRPITCLPTLYKIISSIICNKIYTYLECNNILSDEQKGCKKGAMGCKEQIITDSVIMENARKQKRNLFMTYVDYEKAFDSIPHDWLIKTLLIYGINNNLTQFLKTSMKQWKTRLILNTEPTSIQTDDISIRRGIFQGDSLSALWFCLALNPLSFILNNTTYGYTIRIHNEQRLFTHLLYMDDLKLYASNESQLKSVLKIVNEVSENIGMKFGLKKCQTVNIKKGILIQDKEPMNIKDNIKISAMSQEPYKYLGVLQTNKVEHKHIKEMLIKELMNRLHSILRTKLKSRNIVMALNTYVIPAISYSFGIINWSQTDLEHINTKIRTALTIHKMHHPRACIERVNIERERGGRGIIDVVEACDKQVQAMRKYFHSSNLNNHRFIVKADKSYTPLKLNELDFTPYQLRNKEDQWASKELHGRFHRFLNLPTVDKCSSTKWLVNGELYPETEGFVIGIQDNIIGTKNIRKFIHKERIDDRCRRCQSQSETIEHLLSGCQTLASNKYLIRHNKVATIIYLQLLKYFNLPTNNVPYYQYNPPPVEENETVTIYWDKGIITDLTVTHNRPDITLINKQEKTVYLIDVSVPNNSNMESKFQEKMEKYSDLKREVQLMWKMDKVYIVPIIISAMGLIPKNLATMLKLLNLPYNVQMQMQKSILLDAVNITRSVLEITT